MFGGDAGSGVIGVSGGGGDALELHGEHSEVEDLDEGEFSLVLSKLNLDLFCFEWRVDGTLVTLFCIKCVLSVVVSVRENLWNLLPHLHGAKISELSFIICVLIRLVIILVKVIIYVALMFWKTKTLRPNLVVSRRLKMHNKGPYANVCFS